MQVTQRKANLVTYHLNFRHDSFVLVKMRILREQRPKLLAMRLAVARSRSAVKWVCTVQFEYQDIDCNKAFGIVSMEDTDLSSGTAFIYQCLELVRLNTAWVVIRSNK